MDLLTSWTLNSYPKEGDTRTLTFSMMADPFTGYDNIKDLHPIIRLSRDGGPLTPYSGSCQYIGGGYACKLTAKDIGETTDCLIAHVTVPGVIPWTAIYYFGTSSMIDDFCSHMGKP